MKTKHYDLPPFFHIFFHKSISPFQKWTKKMSKNENPKYFCAKIDEARFPGIFYSYENKNI